MATVLFLALIVTIALVVHQHMIRYRAERILSDLQSITLRHTTFEEVQPVLSRWKHWGAKVDVPCSRDRCRAWIKVGGYDTALNQFLYLHPRTFDLLGRLGVRPAGVVAALTVLDGVVWSDGIAVSTEIRVWQDGTPRINFVAGGARTLSQLSESYSYTNQWQAHPEYVITWPGNYQDSVTLQFTPYADPSQIRRLMDMHLSCLTRWKPCTDKQEIMPVAVAQAYSDGPLFEGGIDNLCDHPLLLELMARDAKNIAVAKVLSVRPEDLDRMVHLRQYESRVSFEDSLKGDGTWKNRKDAMVRNFSESYPEPATPPPPGSLELLFSKSDDFDQYSLQYCSPLLASPSNLALVRRGIAEDTRPPGLPRDAFDVMLPPH